MKLQRLIAILTVLLQRNRISAAALAGKFGVSVRTVYRDMQTLEQAGIPIVTYPGSNGGFGILEPYKIDKKLFTHQDIATLLMSLNSVSGPVSDAKVNHTLEKIKGLIPRQYGDFIEMESRRLYIDMTPWSQNPRVAETMNQVRQALEQNKVARFDYVNRCGASGSRCVEPHQLVLKENNWYLRAWCRAREDFRTFKITRMRDFTILSEHFSPRAFENRMDDFKDWKNDRMIYIDLILDEALRDRAMDFCREENLTSLANGKIAVHMPFVESDVGYGMLLSLGPACEVTGPPHIRAEILHRLERIRAVYGG